MAGPWFGEHRIDPMWIRQQIVRTLLLPKGDLRQWSLGEIRKELTAARDDCDRLLQELEEAIAADTEKSAATGDSA